MRHNIQNALSTATYLCPKFIVKSDLVFFDWCAPDQIDFSHFYDKTEIEALYNHVHILDEFENYAHIEEEPFVDQQHPDFEVAVTFGKLWAKAISCQLAFDFPERSFRVYFTQYDDPIVRFTQKHDNEAFWLDEETWKNEIGREEVMVFNVDGL